MSNRSGKTIKMPKWAKVRLAMDRTSPERTAVYKRMLLSALAAEDAARTRPARRDDDR